MPTSGSRNVVPSTATTRPANAGKSIPAPTHAPCRRISVRPATRCSTGRRYIARRARLPTATAHRLVAELTDLRYLERDPTRRVRLGTRLWELASRGSRTLELRQAAMSFMENLQTVVRQHTQLAVLNDSEALYLERLSARYAVVNITRIAGRLPLHACSSGLVLLAHARAALQERILEGPCAATHHIRSPRPDACAYCSPTSADKATLSRPTHRHRSRWYRRPRARWDRIRRRRTEHRRPGRGRNDLAHVSALRAAARGISRALAGSQG